MILFDNAKKKSDRFEILANLFFNSIFYDRFLSLGIWETRDILLAWAAYPRLCN